MRALVTGANGFAGRHLLRHLLEAGDEVIGTHLGPRMAPDEALVAAGARLLQLDVRDRVAVEDLVRQERPTVCYHLAARAHVATADADPGATLSVNLMGTSHLVRAFGAHDGEAFVLASSARVYGRPRGALVSEDHPRDPAGAYGVSKLAAEAVVHAAAAAYGFRGVSLRLFNHTGAGQGPGYVVPDLANRLAAARRDGASARREPATIRVGNLDVRRDLGDVRDVVEAYRLAAIKDLSGAYNVGRGEAVSIRWVLEQLARVMAMPGAHEVDPRLVRADDPPEIRADIARFQAATGWAPKVKLEDTLRVLGEAAVEAAGS